MNQTYHIRHMIHKDPAGKWNIPNSGSIQNANSFCHLKQSLRSKGIFSAYKDGSLLKTTHGTRQLNHQG